MPALDGLRGVAVLLVLIGHTRTHHFGTAGTAGVTVFFVLSGYLITGLLLAEWQRNGHIDLRRFFIRRTARLAPALLLMLAVCSPLLIWAHPQGRHDVLQATSATVGYAMNLLLLTDPSAAGPYSHAWSLSVEEQFYLTWPAVIIFCRGRIRWVVYIAAGALAAKLVVWNVFDWHVAMYATPVAAAPILAGCAVTLRPVRARASVATAVLFVCSLGPRAEFWGGWPVLTVIPVTAAALVLLSERPRWLEARWLRWWGVRSYGIYLWHYPVMWLPPLTSIEYPLRGLFGAAVAVGVAALSWRFVERPLLVRVRRPVVRRPTEHAGHAVAAGTAGEAFRGPAGALRARAGNRPCGQRRRPFG